MRTLRARLWFGTALGMGGVLAAFAVALYFAVSAALWSEFDEALVGRLRSLASLVEQDGDQVEFEAEEYALPEYEPSPHAEYYQFRRDDGRALGSSPSLGDDDLPTIDGHLAIPGFRFGALPDGRPGRLAGARFTARQERQDSDEHRDHKEHQGHDGQEDSGKQVAVGTVTVMLTVGRETAGVDRTLAWLRLLLVAGSACAMAASAGVLSWLVRRGLRPLDAVAGEIASIEAADLSGRVRAGEVPGELVPVVERLNDLLARLETAFAREKSFTADVAHELRTPLAGVRTTLEVALSRERDAGEYREAMGRSLAISREMQHMVDNLLELARADAGQLEVEQEPVDLVSLLRESWERFADQAAERGLDVTWQLPDACPVTSDGAKLRHVINNIFENAVTHADEAGRVTIALATPSAGGRVAIRVENSGSHIDEADAERVFERFWRGDAARSAKGVGRRCGLGLPLCRKLMTLLGGTISVTTSAGGTFAVTIALRSP